ncbi:MAG: recombinase family protein [Candidatus Gastranaerophilales bacterium]|nr:recombinase family protein [Candidatus Gastranaerophilales bacterium]
MEAKKKTIRCAIYTRKSSEEGLEQDFNSLDAQREACESYIKSQQHEGWVLIDKQYNDGGFSGGTLERPALKKLFQDIENGEVDTVLVYKIDRLTRSLMDFSKIVELFDKRSVTFVSITQQFNTTTSMGRLTLNILLSFAQFEREVTGERIRDKKAASAKKGIWIGGSVPIGYKIEDKKLVPDKEYIPTLETIFEKYIEFESVFKLKSYLEENNIKSRTGRNFSKGNLYKILSNKTYIGMVKHKDTCYNGEHEGIIEEYIFKKAQELLEKNRNNNKCKLTAKSPSLLAGKIFDDKGNRMNPSHSNTRGKRYRYYVSQAIIQGNKKQAGTLTKIPAGEIENFVRKEISDFLSDNDRIQEYISDFDIHKQKMILSKASTLDLANDFMRAILAKVFLFKDKIEIIICKNQLIKGLESFITEVPLLDKIKNEPEEAITISRDVRISTTSRKGSVLVVNNSEEKEVNINSFLINIVAKGHHWNKQIREGKFETAKEIAESEKEHNVDYVKKAIRLNILSPRIVECILSGNQPADLTVEKLCSIKALDWQEQENILCL